MKNTLKRMLTVMLALCLSLQAGAVFAKSETVYLLLDRGGALEKAIVVNSFVGDEESIVDYGDYENVTNLSSSAVPKIEGDKIVFHREGGNSEFYYRGDLKNAENPWNIEIKYYLDGVETDPELLPAASGDFEMTVRVSPAAEGGFADKYTVQMQGSLIGAKEIGSDGASIVAMGSQYTVGAIFLPTKEQEVRIWAKVENGLELSAFTFTGVKAAIDFDIDFDEIEKQVGELSDASAQVLAGIVRLEGGAEEMRLGLSTISGSLTYLTQNNEALKKGLSDFSAALTALSSAATELPKGSEELLNAVKSASEQMAAVKGMAEQLVQAPDPNMVAIGAALLGQMELNAKVAEALSAINAGESAVSAGLAELSGGIGKVTGGADEYLSGVSAVSAGVSKLSAGMDSYAYGFAELVEGQKQFVVGVGDAQAQLADMLGIVRGADTGRIGSFVSSKNAVDGVTFIMRTEELKKPVFQKEPLPPLPKKNLWQKLIGLFGF